MSLYALPYCLQGLTQREGNKPKVDSKYPCPQLEDNSSVEIYNELMNRVKKLPNVTIGPTSLESAAGEALILDEDVAKGQPEAFLRNQEFAIIREDGSTFCMLPPTWGQEAMNTGWARIHPLVIYMAGALPPQSMILYAPRNHEDLDTIIKLIEASRFFAYGKVEGIPLPDTMW